MSVSLISKVFNSLNDVVSDPTKPFHAVAGAVLCTAGAAYIAYKGNMSTAYYIGLYGLASVSNLLRNLQGKSEVLNRNDIPTSAITTAIAGAPVALGMDFLNSVDFFPSGVALSSFTFLAAAELKNRISPPQSSEANKLYSLDNE